MRTVNTNNSRNNIANRIGRKFTVFKTKFGTCGIAWSESGITNTFLPQKDVASLRQRIESFGTDARGDVPAFVERAIEQIKAHFDGTPQKFDKLNVDWSHVPPFHQKIYKTLQKLPVGTVTTYGDLAGLAGSPRAFRAVGQAMAKNPLPMIIPCHRVLSAAGKLGGFSAFGGQETKLKLLTLESSDDEDRVEFAIKN